jgi:predicted kinase
MKPTAYILVGVPGAGKSTWIAKQPFDWNKTVLVSTDGHVEKHAKEQGKTYSDVFKDYMPTAVQLMADSVVDAVKQGLDIVWDQTSTTKVARRKKFNMLRGYEMIAVVFQTPEAKELQRRLASRPGKTIPPEVVQSMRANWEEPTEAEGFDKIIYVK